MDIKKIFEETEKIGEKQNKLRERIYQLNQCLDAIAAQCSHEIVFKYTDKNPRKNFFKESYFCPACASTVHCFYKNELFETEFKSSRVIPLTDLSLKDSNKVNEAIRNEVYGNLDYYYDRNVPIKELSSNMEEKLVDLQTRYEEPVKGLRKFLKRK